MAAGDSLPALLAFTLVEAYFLQRTVFANETFGTVVLGAVAVNFFLKGLYSLVVWPFFLNPLRHLPRVPVCITQPSSPAINSVHPVFLCSTKIYQLILVKGLLSHAKIIFDSPRGRMPLHWMKTIPNEGLIHLRDTIGQSYLLATNHQALLDIMSTNTYDFEKPWRARNFLARILGFGLILSEGAAHKKQRKALTPAFNIKNIRAMYSLMWDKTGQLLVEMEKELRVNPMEGTSPEEGVGKLEMGVWGRYVHISHSGYAKFLAFLNSRVNVSISVASPLMSSAPSQWAVTSAPCKTAITLLLRASCVSWSRQPRK